MIMVKFPEPDFRIKKSGGKDQIFDPLRKQWLVLTEEEWTRQNFIQFMIREMNYPAALIAVEKEFRLGDLKKRFDILVHNKSHQPWMLVECKSPEVNLDEKVMEQLLRYHMSIPVPYLVITNGTYTSGWKRSGTGLAELKQMPVWENHI